MAEITEQALGEWWRDRLRELSTSWFGRQQTGLFAAIEHELPLLRAWIAAIRAHGGSHDDQDVLTVVAGLWPYWSVSGRVDEATTVLREFRQRVSATDPSSAVARFEADWSLAWLALGAVALTDADAAIADATSILERFPDAAREARADQLRGMHALYTGNPHEAAAHLGAALNTHGSIGPDASTFIDLSFLAMAVSAAGRHREAFELCERAVSLCDRRGERWMRTYVVWALAVCSWRVGEHEKALAAATAGMLAAAEFNDVHAGAVCSDVIGWHAAERGDTPQWCKMLGVSAELRTMTPGDYWDLTAHRRRAEEIGKRRHGAAFARYVSEGRRAQQEDSSAWATAAVELDASRSTSRHLTPRQREIAVLIADGRSNKQIARHLMITVRTVETHIEHIFVKLGVVSRAQVAAWSVRDGG